MLPECNLETLSLSHNPILDEGCKYIAEQLPLCNLFSLHLSGCNIKIEGCFSISSNLLNSNLQCLDLSKNDIGDMGFLMFCDLKDIKYTKLNYINLQWNKVSVEIMLDSLLVDNLAEEFKKNGITLLADNAMSVRQESI